ncbi:MAG: alpha-hydroxy-acid oxidizing protein [Dehalococcoidia bacterium]|nr:alpha-hydroxy-acid oxidizing protein [Dehalococcoidia bacterium]
MAPSFPTMEPIILEARRRLAQGAWDYLVGGTESETTLRQNRAGWDRLAFKPRVLVDVSRVDPATTLLGHRLRIPVVLAPVGGLAGMHPRGALAAVEAAMQFGTVPVVSSAAGHEPEAVAEASPDWPGMYQLYIRGDQDWEREMFTRIRAAGYSELTITVDTAVGSLRERPMMSIGAPTPMALARAGQPPPPRYGAMVTWESIDRYRETSGLPILVKGIQTAEDAVLAVEHGASVVWVSNHGGRQLDHARGSAEALAEIAAAVAGRAEIVVDGGIHRGTDVLKALALGARAVAIGRLQGWGLAAAGKDGVLRVLEILEEEILSAMALLGVTCIEDIGPQHISPAVPVTPAHEMSSWPNMPGGRVL